MYNARIFYNVENGDLIRLQTMDGGEPLPIAEDLEICRDFTKIPLDKIGILEYNEYNEKLEALLEAGKVISVDISTEPHTFYGVEVVAENEPIEAVEEPNDEAED